MKYSKKDLINEGWASMETLLNEEMPTNKKDNNYGLIALFVLFAFGLGLFTGTQLDSMDTAEVINQESSTLVKENAVSFLNKSTSKPQIDHANKINKNTGSQEKALNKDLVAQNEYAANPNKLIENASTSNELRVANFNQAPNTHSILSQDVSSKETIMPAFAEMKSKFDFSFLSLAPLKKLFKKEQAKAKSPIITDKVENNSNWVLGLGMNTGFNIDRNTKVLSLNSDWMYKVGKQNSIGVQVLYAAEDNFSSNENASRTTPAPKGQQGGERNPSAVPTLNSKQHRIATGLVIQQEIGYRFYSNFAFGVDMLQNYYTQEGQLKSLSNVQEVRYHLGGYSSLSLGYRLSNLVDLEVSGTKSILVRDAGYVPGNSNHIVGGVKINF